MNKQQAYQYLNEKDIFYDNNANIYVEGGDVMYQLATKIYDNEIETIETKIDDNVYLITHIYKFINNDKKKDWKVFKKMYNINMIDIEKINKEIAELNEYRY